MTGVSTSRREQLVVALAALSGFTDAIGFLHLGGAFASVMTGNIVLFGLSVSTGATSAVIRTAAAIASFIAGAVIGARVAGAPQADDQVWPRQVSHALGLELVVFLGYGAIWLSSGSDPRGGVATTALCFSAIALGLQSAAIQRFGVRNLSTTYFTGTLTTLVIELAHTGRVRESARNLRLLAALVSGAAIGALTLRYCVRAAPLGPVAILLAVVAMARRRTGTDAPREATDPARSAGGR